MTNNNNNIEDDDTSPVIPAVITSHAAAMHNNNNNNNHEHDPQETLVPFGEDDMNLWTEAVPTHYEVEVHLPSAVSFCAGHHHQDIEDDVVHDNYHHHDLEKEQDEYDKHHDNNNNNNYEKARDSAAAAPVDQANAQPVTTWSFFRRALDVFQYTYSTVLLFFCIAVISAAIFGRQTTATGTYHLHPAIAFVVFWVLLSWLALMEGGLNCMVGLQPIDQQLYKNTHHKTYLCTSVAHRGDNIERFIVGRQFFDLSIVFVTNFMVSTITGASVFGLPQLVNTIFLSSGLAVILLTIVFGQLTTQINAAHSMLDFINNWPMAITTRAALFVEASGLLHSVYFIQILFTKISGKTIISREETPSLTKRFFFWLRVAISTIIITAALAITGIALFQGKTTAWKSLPPAASCVLVMVMILLTGIMEGLQIAFMSVIHMPDSELQKNAVAKKNCRLVFQDKKLQSFLIGRQILQTIVMFVIARISTINITITSGVEDNQSNNLFGVSDGLQYFFNTGVPGALWSTVLASLSWRVIAATFPLAFLSNPLSSPIIHVCLMVEQTGICYSAWVTASMLKHIMGYRTDEEHLGAATAALLVDDSNEKEKDTNNSVTKTMVTTTTTTNNKEESDESTAENSSEETASEQQRDILTHTN